MFACGETLRDCTHLSSKKNSNEYNKAGVWDGEPPNTDVLCVEMSIRMPRAQTRCTIDTEVCARTCQTGQKKRHRQ
jgi:hypothetical protein